jgi:hypothetical protein
MIPLAEINSFAQNLRVPAETIEKDYVISWILLCLSKSKIRDNFIFYGGTAIKRMYFEEHRFSEDIDLLSTHKFSIDHILEELGCLDHARVKANLVLNVNRDNIITSKDRAQVYINYSGYDEIVGAPKEIRIDFAMDMSLYGKVSQRNVLETYSDLKKQNSTFSVMTLNTILANKLGLLLDLTRNEPRDLFDIWFLLQRIEKIDYDFTQICEIFKDKFSFRPSLSVLLPRLNNPSIKQNWNVRLGKQLATLPDIEQVIKDITKILKKHFK